MGHIILVYRAGTQSLLHEPETITIDSSMTRSFATGNHLFPLTPSALQRYVKDQASFGMYGYLQVFGKIVRP